MFGKCVMLMLRLVYDFVDKFFYLYCLFISLWFGLHIFLLKYVYYFVGYVDSCYYLGVFDKYVVLMLRVVYDSVDEWCCLCYLLINYFVLFISLSFGLHIFLLEYVENFVKYVDKCCCCVNINDSLWFCR